MRAKSERLPDTIIKSLQNLKSTPMYDLIVRFYYATLPIIGISLALLLFGMINFTYGQEINETSKIYENRDMGIKFLYPSEWGKLIESNGGCLNQPACSLHLEGSNASYMFGFSFGKWSKESCNCNSLIDFVKFMYSGAQQSQPEFSFINDNQTTLGKNYSGWQFESSYLLDGKRRNSLLVLGKNNDNYYATGITYPNESRATLLPKFNKFVDSIEVLPIQVDKTPSFMNTNECQVPTIFEKTLPPIIVGDKKASLYTKISPPDKNQNGIVQLRLFDSNIGNNITNVNYFLTISKEGKKLMNELFYSKEGPLTLEFKTDQSPVKVHGNTEPFLGGWMNETGPIIISGPVLSEGGLYHFGVEIFGIDNVRNIFVPENAPRFDSNFSIDMNGTEQTNPSSMFQTNPSSILESNPNGVQILSHNSFTHSLGYLHVVGEVQNNSPTGAQFVQVTGTFYDNNNQVVGTDFTYTNPSDIGAGQKAPFELILTSASIPVSLVDHYNLVASSE